MLWNIKNKSKINEDLKSLYHPIILELLAQRGITDQENIDRFLCPDYERDIFDPFLFSAMEKVVERIGKAKKEKELVAIYGDYDADGVTATAILQETLDALGIENVVHIPDKKIEGYGMNMGAVDDLKNQNVKLIITVDCGISNYKEAKKANDYKIDVIIIDHHHIPKNIPEAFAIINPHLSNSGYPFADLAGVGVVFKVTQALYKKFLPEKTDQLKWQLDLVALGTVADCVSLIGENRAIVKFGLIVLSKTRRLGLRELFQVGRISVDENNFPDSRKISFQIAPRINAAGRMDHANTAFNLIRSDDQVLARDLALELESNNQARQKATNLIVNEIRVLAENMFKNKKFIFAVGEHFPIGIVGLAAGKIADEFNKPTAVLQKDKETSQGSFRSIPQVNIIEAIEKCQDYLEKFGGHSQAAGITIKNSNLDKFFEKLNKIIEEELKDKDVSPKIEIDSELSANDIDFSLADGLKKLEPFGEGNPEPVFLMKNMIITDLRIVGNGSKHLKLFLRANDQSPKIFECIGFGLGEKFKNLKINDQIDIVFTLSEDEWNGNKKIQLKLIDLKIV